MWVFFAGAAYGALTSTRPDCRIREVHNATNAAARLERLAQYHILGWKALQMAIDDPTSDSESADAPIHMLMDSVSSYLSDACSSLRTFPAGSERRSTLHSDLACEGARREASIQ